MLTQAMLQLDSPSFRRGRPLGASHVARIDERKFELPTLSLIFLGYYPSQFFTFATAFDLYGVSWTLCTVFASTLADEWPIGGLSNSVSYFVYVAVFVAIAVPLSCTSILDQLYIQLFFLIARMVMVFLMIATLIAAFAQPSKSFFGDQVGPARDVPLADWPNLMSAIQTAIFATAFQFSVPAIAHVTEDKRILTNIFQRAVVFVFVANIILALMTSIYLGRNTNESNNLNWLLYHGGTVDPVNLDTIQETRSTWSSVVAYYIVMFAAIDGVAIYPLLALSLGDILMGAVYGERVHEMEQCRLTRAVFRLVASLPQAVGALFVRELSFIALFAGIFTVLSYSVCPSVLCIMSHKRMKQVDLSVKTFYSSTLGVSSYVWAQFLLVTSILIIIGVIVDAAVIFSS